MPPAGHAGTGALLCGVNTLEEMIVTHTLHSIINTIGGKDLFNWACSREIKFGFLLDQGDSYQQKHEKQLTS